MIKGITKRVIVVKSPDPEKFEEAIFIVREEFFSQSVASAADLLLEAQKIANGYAETDSRKSFLRLPAFIYIMSGAAFTGLVWLLTVIF